MILETLYEFAKLHGLVPSVLRKRHANYTFHLDPKGCLREFSDERQVMADAKAKRSSNIQPNLLDNVGYTFGLGKHGPKRQEAWLEALRAFKSMAPVATFAQKPLPDGILKILAKNSSKVVAFTVGGESPYEHPDIVEHLNAQEEGDYICRITGRSCSPGFVPNISNLPPNGSLQNFVGFNASATQFDGRENKCCFVMHREVREGIIAAIDHLARYENKERPSAIVATKRFHSKSEVNSARSGPVPTTLLFSLEPEFDVSPLMVLLRGLRSEGETPEERLEEGRQAHKAALETLVSWTGYSGDLYALTLCADGACRRTAVLDFTTIPLAEIPARMESFTHASGPYPLRWRLAEMPNYTLAWRFMRAVLAGDPLPPAILAHALRQPLKNEQLLTTLTAFQSL